LSPSAAFTDAAFKSSNDACCASVGRTAFAMRSIGRSATPRSLQSRVRSRWSCPAADASEGETALKRAFCSSLSDW
jgi:hypothetical protein